MQLLEGARDLAGPALVLGCGSGVVSSYVAAFFDRTIGLDIAFAAVAEAKQVASQLGKTCAFVNAETPKLPFRSGAFGFVFDRGNLGAISGESRPAYFREIERITKPGGLVQVFAHRRPLGPRPAIRRLLSIGIRRGAKMSNSQPKRRERLTAGSVGELLPSSMELLSATHSSYETRYGASFVCYLLRKRA